MQKTDAIVLKVVEFSETSCVVTLLTREFGKITGLAKGARRKKSPFESALDLLSIVRLVFLPKAPKAMDLLTEAKLERRFRAGARCLRRLYRGYYVAELTNLLIEYNDSMPVVYDLVVETVHRLDDEQSDPDIVLMFFELSLLNQLGHRPQFDECTGCGRQRRGDAPRVAFALLAGGVVCPACRIGHRHVLSVKSESIQYLSQLSRSTWNDTTRPMRDAALLSETRELLNHYVLHLVGRPLRTTSYLKMPVAGASIRSQTHLGTDKDVQFESS
ncbi:MAG TPA: DNA repair protein RecO [Pirellulaceae bacterium]|nr:DNA repair protein RecO [Pirellulaceae bacterium]